MTKKWKRYWNKKDLLEKLNKEYPNINFELTVFLTGNKYVLLWEYNDRDNSLEEFFKKDTYDLNTKIQNKIIEIINNLNISKKKTIPEISTNYKLGYYNLFMTIIYTSLVDGSNPKEIKFPYKEPISNSECIIKEIIEMIFIYDNVILKGTTSAYLCYGIGDKIPNDINMSCTYYSMKEFIEKIIEYCKMNRLSYETNFNSDEKKLYDHLYKRHITIKDSITFTFDNAIEIYGVPSKHLEHKNDIFTYTLEKLIEMKTNKIKNKFLNKKDRLQNLEELKKYKEKLKEINNQK